MSTLDLDFTATKNIDLEVNNINSYLKISDGIDIDTLNEGCTVSYSLNADARMDRIKSMSPIVKQVKMSIKWAVFNEDLEGSDIVRLKGPDLNGIDYHSDYIEQSIEIDSNKPFNGKAWNVECEMEFAKDGAIQVEGVTIDFKTNIITVS